MARTGFTEVELGIWRGIYGASGGPSLARLRILVDEYARQGLLPAMMRIKGDLLPFNVAVFRLALQDAQAEMEDGAVQAYYHPAECEKVVGSTAGTWVDWGKLIFEVEGLVPKGDSGHPLVWENTPRTRLPAATCVALRERGVRTASMCTLVSARVVTFFIAAQYEAWGTPDEVHRVNPFKMAVEKAGFKIRLCDARRGMDAEIDQILDAVELSLAEEVKLIQNHMLAGLGLAQEDLTEPVTGCSCDEEGACCEQCDCEPNDVVERPMDIDAEIARAEAHLQALREKKVLARLEETRKAYLNAAIVNVAVGDGGELMAVTLRFAGNKERTYITSEADRSLTEAFLS